MRIKKISTFRLTVVVFIILLICFLSPKKRGEYVWEFQTVQQRFWHEECTVFQPVVDEALVFVSGGYWRNNQSYLFALNKMTGEVVWKAGPYEDTYQPHMISGKLYLVTRATRSSLYTLLEFDRKTGREVSSEEFENFPHIRDEWITMQIHNTEGSDDLMVRRISAPLVKLQLKDLGDSYGGIIQNDKLYVSNLKGLIITVNLITGQQMKSRKIASKASAGLILSGSTLGLPVVEDGGKAFLVGLDPESLEERWRAPLPGDTNTSANSLVSSEDKFFVAAREGKGVYTKSILLAISSLDGTELWRQKLGMDTHANLSVSANAVLATFYRSLEVRSMAEGKLIRQFDLPTDVALASGVADGPMIYAGDCSCHYYGFRL